METVTFYSYKGGVGRTTLLAQCARDLARRGARVVAMDFDLDAPGLHYRLRPERGEVTRGAVDLVDDYLTRGKLYASLDDATYLARTDTPLSSGWVRVLPAGAAPSSSYWEVLSRIDWRSFLYGPGAVGPTFLQDLLEQLRLQYDPHVVLIDSRTGITELSHAALSLLADRVVCVLVDNDENLDGARAVLRGVSARRMREESVEVPLHVVVSRTDPTLPWSAREARIRAAWETKAEPATSAPLKIASVHELPHEPALARADRLDVALHEAPWGEASALVQGMSALAGILLSESTRSSDRPEAPRWVAALHRGAVWSYGQFVMSFGELEVTGLFRNDQWAYAVCPALATATEDLRVAAEDALYARATATAPIRLVASPPADAERCAEPDLEDLVELRDFPFTLRSLLTELDLRLPVDFPGFWGGGTAPRFQVTTERPLSDSERACLEQAFASFGYGPWLRLETDVDESLRDAPPTFRSSRRDGDFELIPARRLPRAFSTNARKLLAAEEALWMARRHDVHAGVVKVPGDLLPDAARSPCLRVLVDATVFPCPGAADLLGWCDQIVLALPLADRADAQLAAMGLDIASLAHLAREGRALVLLPQPLDRYDPSQVNELAETAHDAMVLSRRLCAASIVALQQRLGPWIYPTFGARQRHEFLRRLTSVSRAVEHRRGGTEATAIFRALLPTVRDQWPRCEVLAHLYGADAMSFSGVSTLIAETLRQQIPGDFTLESGSVAAGIAWADAFGAVFAPADLRAPGYSERRLCEWALRILAILADLPPRSPDLRRPSNAGPWMLRAPGVDASAVDAASELHAMLKEVGKDAVPRDDAPPLWMLTRG